MKKTKRARYCLVDERGIIDACLFVIDDSIRVCCNDFVTHTQTYTNIYTYTSSHTYTYTHTHTKHTHTHTHQTHTHTHTQHIYGNLDSGLLQRARGR